ncbi:MAG: UDP-N-acetylglucosamine--LPS N-acetylglucosamine transferase [bacterium]|nr:UDP-N-acetylglucosamine--LPS N-acetylglucosamine transferase [bacterium]
MSATRRKILAVSSGGGHWTELLRLLPAFEGNETVFVIVHASYRELVPGCRCHIVNDATRWSKLGLLVLALRIILVLLRERPDVVVSTGAAPGYFAVRFGKTLGARTIWLDSIANAEQLSLSGQRIGPYADLWLTQWPQLARAGGPQYAGAVL